jgi:hypothetical protein
MVSDGSRQNDATRLYCRGTSSRCRRIAVPFRPAGLQACHDLSVTLRSKRSASSFVVSPTCQQAPERVAAPMALFGVMTLANPE